MPHLGLEGVLRLAAHAGEAVPVFLRLVQDGLQHLHVCTETAATIVHDYPPNGYTSSLSSSRIIRIEIDTDDDDDNDDDVIEGNGGNKDDDDDDDDDDHHHHDTM